MHLGQSHTSFLEHGNNSISGASRKKLTGEKISIMNTVNYDGKSVVHQTVGTTVGQRWIGLMKMLFDVLITFDAKPLTGIPI
jgi:hypothetical protein